MYDKVVICGVETSGLPKLSNKEQEELMRRIKAGDNDAREKFIVGNMRLVLSLVKRFWSKKANADDVFQVGCVGLIKAIDNFDVTVGVRFSTYAVPIILVLRNRQKELKMTRNQALLAVFALFEDKNRHTEEIKKLKEVATVMPFTEWDDATVKDAVEYFMLQNDRLPTVTDFKKENGLPSNPVIKQRYKMNLREWLDKNFPVFYRVKTTRRKALQFAYESLSKHLEYQAKIGELIEEYPVCRWTSENIIDAVEEFFRCNDRLPYEREFKKINHLPDYGHLLYKYKCGLREFYETNCNELFINNESRIKPIRDYLKEFVEEYERIKPLSKQEFDRYRNPEKCCLAEVVMRNTYITTWAELLKRCNLQPYEKQKERLILHGEVIMLNEYMEETKRYICDAENSFELKRVI